MTTRKRRMLAIGVVTTTAVAAGIVTAVTASAAPACRVDYVVTNQWQGGFGANVTINNLGDPINGWTLTFTFPAGQTITQAWNAQAPTGTSQITASNMSYNPSIPTGGNVSFGFNGAWSGSNPAPTSFTLNGTVCNGGTTPTTPATTRATTAPTTRATTAPTTRATTPPTTRVTTPPTSNPPTGTTPVAINGQLRVCGVNLCNQYGRPIQLRGMSSHGIQWFANCVTNGALDAFANDWRGDVFRIAMYVQEQGYETDPARFTQLVHQFIDMVSARGLYVIVDFHTLTPGDPNYNLSRARTFFQEIASRHAGKNNIIYEIANEPNGVSWAGIKSYAEQVIPVIRNLDGDAPIIVGTRAWSSLGVSEGANENEIINNPVNASNIMYAFHFYAASHRDNYRQTVQRAAARLPIFVSEWGVPSATGDGAIDLASAGQWLDLFASLKISWVNWNWADHAESGAAFRPGACAAGAYSGTSMLKEGGAWVRERIRSADNFPTS